MSWTICQNALVSYDFHSSCTYFHKNNGRFVISIKIWIYRHVISVLLTKRNFSKEMLEGTPDKKFQKVFWNLNISIYISVDAVFDEDCEFDIIFVGKWNLWYFYAETGSYLASFAFLLHFSTKIISNS